MFTFGPAVFGEDLNALASSVTPGPLDGGPHGAEDVAWLLYTGGTTGIPRAAMLPERALAQLVWSVLAGWHLPREKRYLACAPISHAAGMLITTTLLSGGTVVLQSSFDPARFIQAIDAERITLALLVPTMIYAVLDHPDLDRADLSSLETIMYGASPISPTRLAEGLDRMGPVFCQLYGQTECSGIATSLSRSSTSGSAPAHVVRHGDPRRPSHGTDDEGSRSPMARRARSASRAPAFAGTGSSRR